MSYSPAVGAQVSLHGPQSEEWTINAIIPGSAGAGTVTQATINRQAITGPQTFQQCPGRETWALQRIYSVGTAPATDGQLVIFVDQVSQPYQPYFSSVNLAQNRPAALSNQIFVNSASVVTAAIVNPIANAVTAGVSVTFLVQTLRQAP